MRSRNNSKWQAYMRETDADRSWQPRRTVNQQTRWTKKIQRKAFSCLVTALYSQSRGPGGACACTLLWKSELRFGKRRFKSGDTKTEAQCSCLLPQRPKEICSMNRRDWWLENSRGRKRISGQSPVRWRAANYHYSVDIIRGKPKLHTRDGEESTNIFRAVTDAKIYLYWKSIGIWQALWRNIMESSKQLHFINQRQAELQNELYVEQ